MAITSSAGGTTITGDDINVFAWMTCRRALAFEIKTGMKMSRVSALKAAKANGWTDKNTKAAALKQMNEQGKKMGFEPI